MGNSDDYARMSPRDKLATARLKARSDSPYFSAALLALIPRETPGLGTLAVTDKMLLLWDAAVVQAWPLDELAAVLEHEVMHVLRDHAGRARRMGLVGENGRVLDQRLGLLWNLAGDCEINDDFEKTRPQLFKGDNAGVLPSTYKLPNGLVAEAYFDALRKKADAAPKQPKPRSGQCGGCCGNPNEGEPQEDGSGNKEGKKPSKGSSPGDVSGAGEGRTQAEVERVRKQVAHAIQDAGAKGRGNIPGSWQRWADANLAPPKIRWQDKLARAARAAVAWRAGMVDLTRKRMSRRQWGIGFGAGRPMVAAHQAPVPKVAVAIDTSGSMGKDELTACLEETVGVLAAVGGSVTLCTCDAEVHGLRRARNAEDVRKLLHGGGGTDFRPVFAALEAAPGGRPDVLIFITDGGGPAPAQPPLRMQVIWVLVGAHKMRPMAPGGGSINWGTFIEISED